MRETRAEASTRRKNKVGNSIPSRGKSYVHVKVGIGMRVMVKLQHAKVNQRQRERDREIQPGQVSSPTAVLLLMHRTSL